MRRLCTPHASWPRDNSTDMGRSPRRHHAEGKRGDKDALHATHPLTCHGCRLRCRGGGNGGGGGARVPLSVVTAAFLIFVAPVQGQGILVEEGILLSNPGIQVPLGRSVYLTQSDLQIRVSPGDRCMVTVLDNDPLAQRPGRLMPTAFPCDFGPQEVVYSHFGSRNPPNDRINLQVR